MGSQTFTVDGTWVCPAGVTALLVECYGAGGGGGADSGGNAEGAGGGGGGGAYARRNAQAVTPFASHSYAVGVAGTASTTTAGGKGGDTTWVSADAAGCSAIGGSGGGRGVQPPQVSATKIMTAAMGSAAVQ